MKLCNYKQTGKKCREAIMNRECPAKEKDERGYIICALNTGSNSKNEKLSKGEVA